MQCKNVWLVTALAGQMTLACVPAFADASVHIAGNTAFSIPAGAGALTPTQRAATMQKNIDNALVAATDRSPTCVAVSNVNGQKVLTLGGFYIASADDASAKKLGLTSTQLAQRWSSGLKATLSNRAAVDAYINRLTASPAVAQAGTTTTSSGSYPYYRQGRVAYIPAGMMMPVTLNNGLSSESARAGDPVQASLVQPINLGDSEIPANSVLLGTVTDAVAGRRMSHSGALGLKFTRLRMPDGVETPITAHIVGGLNNYQVGAGDEFHGETTKQKVEHAALDGAIGAGSGAIVGTVIGAIASHGYGHGVGRGALAGLGIGAGLGVAESVLLRKGKDVKVESGKTFNLQLDAPATVAINNSGNM